MSRLLFASARGARIEYGTYSHTAPNNEEWIIGVDMVRMRDAPSLYRIHPEDAHLAYGPISTALRERATNSVADTDYRYDVLPYMDVSPYIPEAEYWDWLEAGELPRSIFLLILADEGL